MLTSLSGLAIHLPPRAGQQAAHTDAATLKARREITPRELFFLRQDEQGPVRDHWNNFMRARFTQVNHGTRPEGAPFQAFLHQQEGSFRNPESRGYVEFQTYLTQMRPPYLRAHLERDIAAGRFSQPLANAALGVRPAAVTQLTPEEFIADVRGRGPVFQREVKQLIDSGRTPEIAIAEVTTRLTELSERAHPYGTGIPRPTTEDLSRHRQAVLDNRPLPEAVTAVATLASPRIHAQRAQFVGSELQPLLPLIESAPARFGLTAEDVRTLSQRRFAGDDPTGVRRVALTDAELQAAGITRSDITVSQPVSLARAYYTRHEAELLAAMPPALLNQIFATDRGGQRGFEALAEAIRHAERSGQRGSGGTQITDIRILPPEVLTRAVRELRQETPGTPGVLPPAIEQRLPGFLRGLLTSEAPSLPFEQARQAVATLDGVQSAPPSARPVATATPTVQTARAEGQERSTSV